MIIQAPLVRTIGGAMVHRPDCGCLHRNGGSVIAVTWLWAVGRDIEEVRRAMPLIGSRGCGECRPFGEQNDDN